MRAHEFIPVVEAMPAKPQKPLTPAQMQKRSEKQARTRQRVQDEDTRHTAKIRDLNTRLP
jgi:hypothetical protein